MDFIHLARKRFSSRKYLPKQVEDEHLIAVLEAGRIAPSAVNYQPWHFVVIREPDNLKKLAGCYHREWFEKAPVVIVICGDHGVSWTRKDGKDHCDIDVAIAVDHMTLAATDLGLATCWVCNFDPEKTRELLQLPGHVEPIVMLPLAYPEDTPDLERHVHKRKQLAEIVHWEKY